MTYYFIYETTNLINGKKYRGMHKTENLEDGYLGSGFYFINSLKKHGVENFTKEILEFCDSYDKLIEKEKIYVNEEWVRSENTYNLKTGGQSAGILSDESKNKISDTLKRRYKLGEIVSVGPKKGSIPWNKGKEMTEEIKMKNSMSQLKRYLIEDNHPFKLFRNKNPWNKGKKLGPQSEESKKKKSETLKERFKNQPHHSLGVDPWNKGKKGVQVAWNKGKEMSKSECPHCGKLVDSWNGKRWHFDNCKFKPNE